MKINSDFQNFNTGSIKDAADNKDVKGTDTFSSLLNQASAAGSAGHVRKTAPITESAAVFQHHVLSSTQADVLATGEHTLELLEHCSCMLDNNDISKGMLQPVAGELDNRARDLMQLRDTLDIQDPLRNAIDEIGVMSVVTSMKIKRGDFNSP